jgi:small-conductance mechanosensitive channel
VEEAFQLIGGADSGVAALAESNIAAAMRGIYEQREACSKTLANTAGLVRNVGRLLTVLLGIVALFISLGIFQVDVANLWLVFSSALLAFAFVFGQTAATMFRALIMIFVTNPFGVGDWVRFGDDPVAVKIQELGLNFVVVETFWGEVIFLPVSCASTRASITSPVRLRCG